MSFSELSITLTKNLSNDTKKNEGIYFTPKGMVKKIIDFVLSKNKNIESILEPSCGSGEFIEYLEKNGKNVFGIENNLDIYNAIKDKYQVKHSDFLEYNFEQTFDLVIGNPPYFVIPKSSVHENYYKYFDGRPNIYILFIVKAFKLLNKNGILAFVLPTNFLNCIYYNKLRNYLKDYKILDIYTTSEKFLETSQEVCVFIIQKCKCKCKNNERFIVNFEEIFLFKPEKECSEIKKLKSNSTNLFNLGCKMNIGNIVWNQCKKELTDDNTKPLLIYSSNIKNNCLEIMNYANTSKKNYINKQGSKETVLLVNRGYGTGKYNLNYCLIDENDFLVSQGYLVENHCIVIHSKDPSVFQVILKSFENKKTKEFIDLVFSNNAINLEEFLYILPIFTD